MAFSSPAAEIKVIKESKVPNQIQPGVIIVPAIWTDRIPPYGRVNAPEPLTTVYPGQKIAVSFLATGPDREILLKGLIIQVRISARAKTVFEQNEVKAKTIRPIKPEGDDMTLAILNAGGISTKDRAGLESATSMVSVAFYPLDWTPPSAEQGENIQIAVTVSNNPTAMVFGPLSITIRPSEDWLRGPSRSEADIGQYLNRYHADLPPGQLIVLLKGIVAENGFQATPVLGFFGITYRENAAARNAAVALFPALDPKTQFALATAFCLAGQDTAPFLPAFSAEAKAVLNVIKPLKDPRDFNRFKDPVAPDEIGRQATMMDVCWGGMDGHG